MKVAYLTHSYPVYSQTFSVDEVRRVRDKGVRLSVFSITKPDPSLVTDTLEREFERTSFVRPVPILRLLRTNIWIAATQPGAYFRTVLRCIRANAVSMLQAMKGALHFLEAVELGERLVHREFDCLHIQFADTAATYAAVIHQLHKLPYSVAVHAHDIFEHRYTNRLVAFRIGDAKWIRVISDFNRKFLHDETGIDADRIEVVRCGIDVSKLRRSSAREANTRKLIVSVGRLVPYKGHDILIRACRQLKDQGVDLECKIVGDGAEHAALSKLILDLDLQDTVELVGVLPHSEICRMLDGAAVFALACRRADDGAMDGIPVALMEAMAMELPVVTTAISGIPELVEHENTGLIAATDDPADFGNCILKVLSDPQLAGQLGHNARRKVESDFNQETIAEVLADRICLSAWSDIVEKLPVSVQNPKH